MLGRGTATRWLRLVALLAACLAGATAALATLGPRILDVRDLGWLLHGTLGPDPVAYWLAWRYFAPAPWSWPPALNPDYGLELASSIFYVDVVPLAAIIAKALRPLVEIPQYWGPWIVLCAGLQAFFGWHLLRLVLRDPVALAFGATLFAWQPMLLNRMGGHFALVAQWVILWALWLCLRERQRGQAGQWTVCLGLIAMLNPYIMSMAAGLWLADLVARWRGGLRGATLAMQALLPPLAMLIGLWLAGYFSLGSRVEAVGMHYGEAQLDLTAPFDAAEWGRLLPELPGLRHWEHGGSYLGAGTLLLLAVAAWLAWRHRMRLDWRRHGVLVAMLGGMLAYAISHQVAIGGRHLLTLPVPGSLLAIADMLRSSERYFWPIGYAAIVLAVGVAAARLPASGMRLLLAGALLLQVVDISAGIARFRALTEAAPPVAAERLPSPFWDAAATRYQRVRGVPTDNFGAHWEPVARFAAAHRLPTDVVYMSRVDPGVVDRLRLRTLFEIREGRWERDTLYILRNPAARALVARSATPGRDLIAEVDGITVFAPDWFLDRGPKPIAAR
jgi:hypothetical protein